MAGLSAALPIAVDTQDIVMSSSLSLSSNPHPAPSASTFNPASYTSRALLIGSPLSFRAGSFGSRFYPGCSPGQLLGPLDPTDFKCGKMSSSIESDRGSLINAISAIEGQTDEHCRDYQCCGLTLTDLHALVDHFETCHVVVPYAPFAHPAYPNVPSLKSPSSPHPGPSLTHATASASTSVRQPQPQYPHQQHHHQQHHQQQQQHNQHQQYPGAFDADDMELDGDYPDAEAEADSGPSSGASTPPETPISTPISSYPSPVMEHTHAAPLPGAEDFESHAQHPTHGQGHGQGQLGPVSAFDTHVLARPFAPFAAPSGVVGGAMVGARGLQGLGFAPIGMDAFNGYAGYADFSSAMPGAVAAPAAEEPPASASGPASPVTANGGAKGAKVPYGVPPALLFSPSGTPAASRGGSPAPSGYFPTVPTTPTSPTTPVGGSVPCTPSASSSSIAGATGTGNGSGPRPSTTLSRPASSLLLSKPFKCPKPNCNKSYKQANGLKYHITHGSCNFAPPKEVEEVNAVLADRHRAKVAADGGVSGEGPLTVDSLDAMSEGELREVEREAEMRLKPFACGIGECLRRYKNMNGLRYHYQHSGDHGAIGLALLASGQHECLRNGHNRARTSTSSTSSCTATPTPSAISTATSSSRPASAASSPTSAHPPAQGIPQPVPQVYTLQQRQQAFAFLTAQAIQAAQAAQAAGNANNASAVAGAGAAGQATPQAIQSQRYAPFVASLGMGLGFGYAPRGMP